MMVEKQLAGHTADGLEIYLICDSKGRQLIGADELGCPQFADYGIYFIGQRAAEAVVAMVNRLERLG